MADTNILSFLCHVGTKPVEMQNAGAKPFSSGFCDACACVVFLWHQRKLRMCQGARSVAAGGVDSDQVMYCNIGTILAWNGVCFHLFLFEASTETLRFSASDTFKNNQSYIFTTHMYLKQIKGCCI